MTLKRKATARRDTAFVRKVNCLVQMVDLKGQKRQFAKETKICGWKKRNNKICFMGSKYCMDMSFGSSFAFKFPEIYSVLFFCYL